MGRQNSKNVKILKSNLSENNTRIYDTYAYLLEALSYKVRGCKITYINYHFLLYLVYMYKTYMCLLHHICMYTYNTYIYI